MRQVSAAQASLLRERVPDAETADRVDLAEPDRLPPLTVVAGPCRSGTTALLRAAAATGHPAYFQPLKRLIRKAMAGEEARFALPPGPGPAVLKETFGPFVIGEAAFDPVSILRSRGYPESKLSLIVTLRHPVDLYHSWKRLHEANSRFDGLDTGIFVAAFRQGLRVHRQACDSGLVVTAFATDGLADRTPASVLAALFARHGLEYAERAVDWRHGRTETLDASIVRGTDPEVFRATGSLDGVRRSTAYRLSGPTAVPDTTDVPDPVAELVPAYETFTARSRVDLGGTE
ncbi:MULTISPECIES: hypothetical protein [unclassified Streptomyces]|uniref:hypothetical protein n=1 Tax=unclassified Streptomyces TaxID=2593676 RepID=UPI0036EB4782